eukprot:scaffold38236_cov36-Tisochrysis_lutea.AAC.2
MRTWKGSAGGWVLLRACMCVDECLHGAARYQSVTNNKAGRLLYTNTHTHTHAHTHTYTHTHTHTRTHRLSGLSAKGGRESQIQRLMTLDAYIHNSAALTNPTPTPLFGPPPSVPASSRARIGYTQGMSFGHEPDTLEGLKQAKLGTATSSSIRPCLGKPAVSQQKKSAASGMRQPSREIGAQVTGTGKLDYDAGRPKMLANRPPGCRLVQWCADEVLLSSMSAPFYGLNSIVGVCCAGGGGASVKEHPHYFPFSGN